MAAGASWIVVFNRIPALIAAVEAKKHSAALHAAEIGAERARSLAPVDTGELRDSIHAVLIGHGEAEIRVEARHAPYVEFGTYKMAAQPYLSPALEGLAEEMLVEFAGVLGA